VEEVWPKTRGQRCCVHNTANVLNKLPNSRHPKKDALAAFDAGRRTRSKTPCFRPEYRAFSIEWMACTDDILRYF
jgi:transposase-like protein